MSFVRNSITCAHKGHCNGILISLQLVGKMECDDEQMTGHIAELLVDLDQRQQSKERGLDREGEGEGGDCEGGECEGGGEQVDRTSIMDTT